MTTSLQSVSQGEHTGPPTESLSENLSHSLMCSWEGHCDLGRPLERAGPSRERSTSGNQALGGIGAARGGGWCGDGWTGGGKGLTETGGLGRDVGTGGGEEHGGTLTAVSGGVEAGSCAQRPSNFAI
jgi:hypothetical protein